MKESCGSLNFKPKQELSWFDNPQAVRAFKEEVNESVRLFNKKIQKTPLESLKRKARKWAIKQGCLTSEQISTVNIIFMFRFGGKIDPLACWKVGREGDPSQGIFERFVWQAAQVFGVEEFFIPTTTLSIPTDQCSLSYWNNITPLYGKSMHGKCWQREDFPPSLKKVEGSFKYYQKGRLLENFRMSPSSMTKIEFNHLMRAVVVSIIFGMYDAHANNIMITPDGKIKFFDNTRTFPHSNGAIKQRHCIVTSYRCSLFFLKECFELLTGEQKTYLQQTVEELKGRVPAFIEFMKRPEVQHKLEQLTPGWFRQDLVEAALLERVEMLSRAVVQERLLTLADLPSYALPDFSFYSIVGLIDHVMKGKIEIKGMRHPYDLKYLHKYSLLHAPVFDLDKFVKLLPEMDINPLKFRKTCNSMQYTFRQLIQIVQNATPQDLDYRLTDRTIVHIRTEAQLDFKDLPWSYVFDYIEGRFLKLVQRKQIQMYIPPKGEPLDVEVLTDDLQVGSSCLLQRGDGIDQLYIFRKEFDGEVIGGQLDLTQPGYVTFVKKSGRTTLPYREFCDWAFPPFYHPELKREEVLLLLESLPHKTWVLWFDRVDNCFTVTCMDAPGSIITNNYASGTITSNEDLLAIKQKYKALGYKPLYRKDFPL